MVATVLDQFSGIGDVRKIMIECVGRILGRRDGH